jgi:D-alanyl-D-alanine carboxypeptidase
MTRALLALLLVLGHLPVAAAARRRAVQHPAAPVPPAAIVTAARQAAEAAMTAGVPAVQIAVSQRGEVIYSEAFGLTDKPSATAATPRSVMQIASVTKQFTAAAILRLAERGALTLDDPIEKFVPEFNPQGRTITLRRLLSHTSGLRRDWLVPGVDLTKPITRPAVISALNSKPFDFPTGQKFSYSNAAYMLLGYAIESITGRPYAEFIHQELALPLGLIDTGVCGAFNLPLPEGYGLVSSGLWIRLRALHPTAVQSSGGLCSTASDLARWSHFLADGRVMLPASYATMTTPARLENNALVPNGYSLGVHLQQYQGHPVVWHNGAIDGYQSFLHYFPDQDIAVAVITNGFPAPPGGNPQIIAMAVANAALAAQ